MNILVTERYACKIADFGCSKMMPPPSSLSVNHLLMTMGTGTPLWMAPEVPSGNYSYPTDIYSLGLVLYELYQKSLPQFDTSTKLAVLPSSFSSSPIILPLTSSIPSQRPTSQKVVKMLDRILIRSLHALSLILGCKIISKNCEHTGSDTSKNEIKQFTESEIEENIAIVSEHLSSSSPQDVDCVTEHAFATQAFAYMKEKEDKKQSKLSVQIPVHISSSSPFLPANSQVSPQSPLQPSSLIQSPVLQPLSPAQQPLSPAQPPVLSPVLQQSSPLPGLKIVKSREYYKDGYKLRQSSPNLRSKRSSELQSFSPENFTKIKIKEKKKK